MLRMASRLASETVRVYPCDITDASDQRLPSAHFDVVWCLWNVLGHALEHQQRHRAIEHIAATLRSGGRLFIDVSNRYNIAQYGLGTVAGNVWADVVRSNPENGTVGYAIAVALGKTIASSSHFFHPGELAPLFFAANLRPLKRVFVHYQSGAITHRWGGQIFFVVEKI
jgi:SAM-dependent methyltransferase